MSSYANIGLNRPPVDDAGYAVQCIDCIRAIRVRVAAQVHDARVERPSLGRLTRTLGRPSRAIEAAEAIWLRHQRQLVQPPHGLRQVQQHRLGHGRRQE